MSVVRTRAFKMVLGGKRKVAQAVLSQALSLPSHAPDTGSKLLAQALYKIAKNEQQHMAADLVAQWMDGGLRQGVPPPRVTGPSPQRPALLRRPDAH